MLILAALVHQNAVETFEVSTSLSPCPLSLPQDGHADPTSSTYLSLAETVLIYTFL